MSASKSTPATTPAPVLPEGLDHFEATRAMAAAAHLQIVTELSYRASLASISTPQLLSIGDHMYKVSGLSARQEAKAQGSFVFNIHLGSSDIKIAGEKAPIDAEIVENPSITEISPELGALPAFMRKKSGNLAVDLAFEA